MLKRGNKKNIYGFTLTELMISMSISLIVLSGAIALFSVNSNFGGQHIQKDFLRSQLNLLATTLSDEIARSGFCYDCTSTNPFMLTGIDGNSSAILLDDSATKIEGTCIRFAYNHDKRENTATIDKDDQKGYRLGGDPLNNPVIEIYETWGSLKNWNCTDDNDKASSHWQDLTNLPLIIEDLKFERKSFLVSGSNHVLQNVVLTIAASLISDPSIRDSVTVTINVQNVDS